ncbi:hypothetical protein OPV22_019644 [Ensete ventricosum]|uniref:Uncharacterized protein n=1 Tax=Ensete ventricosum TaxID=4639 RepID=A0AAV8QCJ1_ENSVE|nr:hypothetical protein OPV22_019644 [Ensete ventricosum]
MPPAILPATVAIRRSATAAASQTLSYKNTCWGPKVPLLHPFSACFCRGGGGPRMVRVQVALEADAAEFEAAAQRPPLLIFHSVNRMESPGDRTGLGTRGRGGAESRSRQPCERMVLHWSLRVCSSSMELSVDDHMKTRGMLLFY